MLIIAVVIFLCCFGGSIGNPFESTNKKDNPIVNFLGRFTEGSVVPAGDVTAPCKSPPNTFTIVSPQTSCVLSVPARDVEIRNLILSSDEPFEVHARIPRSDDTGETDVDEADEADGRFRIKVAIDERSAQVTLICVCTVIREDGS
jgi:hypothetical protein